MTRDAHALGFVLDHPWAIDPSWLAIIAGVLASHVARDMDDATIAAARMDRKDPPTQPGGGVAIIPVYGVIAPRANRLMSMSGGTSYDVLGEELAAALANPKVQTIIFDVDSPGGSVAGATEFAAQVREARAQKTIIAQAQFKMGSSAYWLSSSATKIHAAPSALVGSVGVYGIHEEISKALEQKGITRTYLSAGKHKVVGNETVPLTEETHAILMAPIHAAYDQFVGDIAASRGRTVEHVTQGYGEGKAVTATEAFRLGMIDRIATLDETIADAQRGTATAPHHFAASVDTPQEPDRATGQDRRWAHHRQVLDVALAQL